MDVPETTTVLKGLENMKIGMPLPILELFKQLQGLDVMEFEAMHSSGATVNVKMSCTDVNLIFEIQAAGKDLLMDEGDGWQCMINHVTGVVYHHSTSQLEVQSQTATEDTDNGEQLVYYAVGENEQAATFETPEESVPHLESGDVGKVEPVAEATEIKTEVIEDFPTAQGVGSVESVPLEYVAFEDGEGREWNTAINYITHLEVEKMEEAEQEEDNVQEEVIQTMSSAGVVTQGAEIAMALEECGQNPIVAGEEVLTFMGQPEVKVASKENPGPSKVPRIVHDVSAFACYICDRKYVLVEKLETHVHRMHKAVFDIHKVQKTVLRKAHICFLCNQVCPHYDAMKKHLQRVHKTGDAFRNNRKVGDPGVSPVQCMICQKQFVSPPCLYNHTRKEHKNDAMYTAALHHVQDLRLQHRKRRSKLTMDCPLCAKTFHGRILFNHLNRDHADVENIAEVLGQCKTAYNKASKQVWQSRCPLKSPSVNCTKCNISILRRNLPRHLKLCTGKPRRNPEASQKCPLCNKIFLKSALARHMKELCSANPDGKHIFMCKCDQFFGTFGQLSEHLTKVHGETINTSHLATENTGNTVYVCGPCEGAVSFATVNELDEHTRLVHLRRPATSNFDDKRDDEMAIRLVSIESAPEESSLQNGPIGSSAVENVPFRVSQSIETMLVENSAVSERKNVHPKPKRGTYAEKIQLLKYKMEQDSSDMISPGTSEAQFSNCNVAVAAGGNTPTKCVDKEPTVGKWIHTKDGILKWDSGSSAKERSKKGLTSCGVMKDYTGVSFSSAGNQIGTVDTGKAYMSDVGDRKVLLLPRTTTSSSSWSVTGETDTVASTSASNETKDKSQSQNVQSSTSPKQTILVLGTSGKAKQPSKVMTVGSSSLASLQYQGLLESRVNSGEPSCQESKACTNSAERPPICEKTNIKTAKPQARPGQSHPASQKLVTVVPPARRVLLAKIDTKKNTASEPPQEPEVEREEVQRQSNQRRSSRQKKPKTWGPFEVGIK